jgi:hypothetical protein
MYWSLFTDLKFKDCYCEFYRNISYTLDKSFTFAGLVLSAGGLASIFTERGIFAGTLLLVLGQMLALVDRPVNN